MELTQKQDVRGKIIQTLTNDDLNWFLKKNGIDAEFALADILMNGFVGFGNMSDEDLQEELRYRDITLEEETV